MNKINIGFLGNQIAPGGGSSSLLLMIKSLDKSKFNIFVLSSDCASQETLMEFKKHAIKVLVNKKLRQFVSCAGHKPKFSEYIWANSTKKQQSKIVINFIIKNKIQILHINNAVFSHIYSEIKSKINVKIISHIREQIHLYKTTYFEKFIIKNIEKYSDIIIAISNNEALPFNKKQVEVLANPFDFSTIDNITKYNLRQKYSLTNSNLLIAMMGRFAPDKGQMLFVKTINYINQIAPGNELVFVIIGMAPPKPLWKLLIKKILMREDYRNTVLKHIEMYDLNKQLVMIPYTKNIIPLINEMDIIVRPSLTMDPWGRDIIEAMALGKCVIATGNSEFFITNRQNGFLVNSLNPAVLGDQILELANNRNMIKKIGDRAAKDILNKTDLHKYGKQIEKIYTELLKL